MRFMSPLWAAVLVVGLASVSCTMLPNLPAGLSTPKLVAPTIAYQGATLARAPSQTMLAAYYCPEVVALPLNGSALLCQQFFGRRPTAPEMAVVFDMHFRVSNPNHIPVPLASVLAAVTLYPTSATQRLGAVCMQLCPEGQPGCTGQPGPGACQASARDIHSLSDFAGAAVNFLIASGIAAASGQPVTFVAPKVSQASTLDVTVRYALSPQDTLIAMKQLAMQSVNQLKAGQRVTFAIPYRLEGTVWFDVGSLGRVAVGFGPADGTWVPPT
jgi:hypothetical protein